MDQRDRYLLTHHRRRLEVARRFPMERQRQDAEHHLNIALRQGRLAYAVMMSNWLSELRRTTP